MMYTDVTALLANSEEQLDRMVSCLGDNCRRKMMKVNANKSEASSWKVWETQCNTSLRGEEPDVVEEFR